MRRSAGDGLPTLALPSLAWSEGEAVHSAALSFLLPRALMEKEAEAEEEGEKAEGGEGGEGGGGGGADVAPRQGLSR